MNESDTIEQKMEELKNKLNRKYGIHSEVAGNKIHIDSEKSIDSESTYNKVQKLCENIVDWICEEFEVYCCDYAIMSNGHFIELEIVWED